MTYKEIVEKVRKEFGSSDVSNYEDHLALQFNIVGEGSGAFYTEINEGKLSIEEFDYKNNDAEITGTSDNIINAFSGKLDIAKGIDDGKLEVKGDRAKAESIQPIIDKNNNAAKKAAVKKPVAEKVSDKRETVVKKTAEKKPAAKKSSSKAADKKSTATGKKA